MKPKLITHKVVLTLLVLALTAWATTSCGGSSSNSSSSTQQQTSQQTAQKAPPSTQQQTAQEAPSSTTASSSASATELVGTWNATSAQGTSLPKGNAVTLTFSDNGTVQGNLQAGAAKGSQNTNVTGQYKVLDGSHLQMSANGITQDFDYSLNGGTLTLIANGATTTFQKAG
ncbi:MAG: lipocalin family protein [Acidobacteriaceae bacterium]|nr:lipocalin family protein [Acidobacteriaceae bacterium]